MVTAPVLEMGLGVVLDLQWVAQAAVDKHSEWVAKVKPDLSTAKKETLHQVTN